MKIPFYVRKVKDKRSLKYFFVSWIFTVPFIIIPAAILIYIPAVVFAILAGVTENIHDLIRNISYLWESNIYKPVDNFLASKLKKKRSKEELDTLVKKLRKKK